MRCRFIMATETRPPPPILPLTTESQINKQCNDVRAGLWSPAGGEKGQKLNRITATQLTLNQGDFFETLHNSLIIREPVPGIEPGTY